MSTSVTKCWGWTVCGAVALLTAPAAAQTILKQEPPADKLAIGQTAYVDDGTCATGQIKKVTATPPRGKKLAGAFGEQGRLRECIAAPKR